MDIHHAKFILQSYRDGGKDAHDPQFAEALRFAKQDPAVNAWLAEELARDEVIRRKLNEFPVPEGLQERILSRRGFGQPAPTPSAKPWLALVATVALLAAAASVWLGQAGSSKDFLSYRSQMVDLVSGAIQLDFRSDKVAEVQQWLIDQDVLEDYQIPAGLQSGSGIGCRQLQWNREKVGLLCFLMKDSKVVHLFVAPHSALADAPATPEPQFASVNGWTTMTWTRGKFVYLMASQQQPEALEKLL
jgi:hypothetical protein